MRIYPLSPNDDHNSISPEYHISHVAYEKVGTDHKERFILLQSNSKTRNE